MISQGLYSKLVNYWQEVGVVCQKASLGGVLAATELAELWGAIGMPSQDWWLFQFTTPSALAVGPNVVFGTVGVNWKLLYGVRENVCFVVDEAGRERFANSSFVSFMQILVLFDECYRKIQRECSGDSGEDWDRGDVIVQETKASMLTVDPQAFEKEENLWPYLLVDING